jgi:hypothetical protein
MLTFSSQTSRQRVSWTDNRSNQRTVMSLALLVAACSGGVQAQTPAQLSITNTPKATLGGYAQSNPLCGSSAGPDVDWSVSGFAGYTGSASAIFAPGGYSSASTIRAADFVAIRAVGERKRSPSSPLSVEALYPLSTLPFGSVTQATRGASSVGLIPGIVAGPQMQVADANIVTSASSIGALNLDQTEQSPVARTAQVKAATTSVALSGFSCASGSITGSESDSCTVKLTAPAPKGGKSVTLTSSYAAVTVPHTVTIAAKATSAKVTAKVSSVTSEHKVTMTASAGGVSKSVTLQLNAAVARLTIEPTSLTFGNVTMDTASTLPVTLASTGTAPVSIHSATLSGTGFTMSGAAFPVTLNPGLAVKVDVRFIPILARTAVGQLTIQSNSSTSAKAVIDLSGTGESVQHEVTLSWKAPGSSTGPLVVGYHIYRLTGNSYAYQLLSSSVTQEMYVDSTVQAGVTYDYYVKSVDSAGVESGPSNEVAATIP